MKDKENKELYPHKKQNQTDDTAACSLNQSQTYWKIKEKWYLKMSLNTMFLIKCRKKFIPCKIFHSKLITFLQVFHLLILYIFYRDVKKFLERQGIRSKMQFLLIILMDKIAHMCSRLAARWIKLDEIISFAVIQNCLSLWNPSQ